MERKKIKTKTEKVERKTNIKERMGDWSAIKAEKI